MTDPKTDNFPKYYLGVPIQRHQDYEDRPNLHRDMRFYNTSLALSFLIFLNQLASPSAPKTLKRFEH